MRIEAFISSFAEKGRKSAVLVFVLLLAWAPFPLGSAPSWATGIVEFWVAGCWIIWILANGNDLAVLLPTRRVMWLASALYVGALTWAVIQTNPILPGLAHPLWQMTSKLLGRQLSPVISIDPWRTWGEILKLSTYGAVVLLVYSMARARTVAYMLLHAIIAIGAVYVVYALILGALGVSQANFIYRLGVPGMFLSGPFMLHNSFATYCGLASLAAVARLVAMANEALMNCKGGRRFALSGIQFAGGRGAPALLAALLTFAAVPASASRAGFAALLAGLLAMSVIAILAVRKRSSRKWAAGGALFVLLPIAAFILFNSETLGDRVSTLLDAGTADRVRLALWNAAWRMIQSAPW